MCEYLHVELYEAVTNETDTTKKIAILIIYSEMYIHIGVSGVD